MFVTTYFEENYIRDKLPTCENYYNVYHPSDCIAYRVEPLIRHFNYERQERNHFTESIATPKHRSKTNADPFERGSLILPQTSVVRGDSEDIMDF